MGSEEVLFPIYNESPIIQGARIDREHFTSPEDSGLDELPVESFLSSSSSEDESDGEPELVLAILNKEPYEPDFDALVDAVETSSEDEESRHSSLLPSKLKHLLQDVQASMAVAVKETDIIAWDISGFRAAEFPVMHSFELTDDTPIFSRARRIPPKYNAIVRKEVDELLQACVITSSSSAWSLPVVIATKKDGRPRFCVDYHQLNRVMKADRWPLPNIEEIFDNLAGAKIFTTLALYTGYWQVQMSESCKDMTIFTYRYGTYKFEVMQFGLMNAPSTFQRMMDGVLYGMPFVMVYVADVDIFSRKLYEHLHQCREVFDRIHATNMKA
eukprot:gb/GEZJ01005542.1/.p1 GENE.gb/GEZJ01005542.1/~~gb/GEZJ01005542.1/.p1  ORF type:complete len:328 (-),score=34.21 gb/GEZJ01005542.1/:1485-2468(-)